MQRVLKSIIFLTVSLLMLFSAYASADSLSAMSVNSAPLVKQSASLDGMVRVYLSSLGSPSSLSITINGSYSLSDGTSLSSGETLTVSFNRSNGALTLKRNGISYSMGKNFTLRRHSTTGSNGVKIAQARKPGNLYPGDLEFKAVSVSGGYKLYTIAHIYLENYLYGVVPYEMGSSAPLEALKAQAVAARTYTVRMMNARASTYYDVVDTTGDQTYNGTPTSVTNCNTAVNQTKGIILKNGSSYTATYYSASNGGQTESVKNAWGSSGYSYLNVHDDPFDYANPDSVVRQSTVYANASSSYNNASLMSLLKTKAVSVLNAAGYHATSSNTTLQTIQSIAPNTPKYSAPSKLYTKMDFTLTVTTYNSSNVFVSVTTTVTCDIFDELESILSLSIQSGENELWSVVTGDGSFSIQSRRYGHAIGMSQRGAMYMGQLGFTYDEILGFYYVGSTRVGCTFTNTILSADSSEVITKDEDPVSMDDDIGVRGMVTLGGSAQLAVRNAKAATANVLTLLSNNTPVSVLANYGSWCKIAYGSLVGYVPTSALTITGTAPDSDDTPVSSIDGFAVVTSSNYLNLRQSGSYSAKILSTAPGGAVLTVLSWNTDWAHIQYGKLTAYAASDFLSFSAAYPGDISEDNTDTDIPDDAMKAIVATKSGSLNMRSQAKAGSSVLTTIPQGTTVSVTEYGTTWSAVSYFGFSGYVMTTYLSFESGSNTPNPEQTEDLFAKVTTASGSLNLRQKPKSGSSIYCTIPQYAIITVHTMNSDWSNVTYNGITGYVMTAFLTVVDSDTADPSDGDESGDEGSDDQNPDDNQDDDSSADDDGTPTATVTTASGSLNLRFDALPGSRVLTRIPQGTTIQVLQKMNTWTYTKYQDFYGYVMNTFLTFSDNGAGNGDENDATPAIVMTASGSLNLRSEPYKTVVTTIPQYAQISVHQRGSSWCYVDYNNIYGYVMTKFLSFDVSDGTEGEPSESEDNPPLDGNSATINVDDGSLNLRAEKSTTAVVLTTIPDGTTVTLMSKADDWCKVDYNGYQGYVQTQYLSFGTTANPTATPEPTATPQPTAPPNVVTAWVNTPDGSLNLRNIPNGDVIVTIPQYAEVVIISDYDETWCKTQYQSYTGYTMSKFLTTTPPEQEAYSVTAWVNTPDDGSLNLRETARGKVLTAIPQHAQVTVRTDIEDTWCQTQYGSMFGYTMSKYLTTTQPGATVQPTDSPSPTATQEPAPTPPSGGDSYSITAWVHTPDDGSLNLRDSENGNVLTTIPQYAQVEVLSNIEAEWCKLRFETLTGYAMTEFITTTQPQQPEETGEGSDPYAVTAWVNTPEGSLNLRSQPRGHVLTTIPQYAEVLVLSDIEADWCQTQYGTASGYTATKFLTTVKPEQEAQDNNSGQDAVIAWVNTPEGSLNLRNVPNGNVLTTIPQYAEVTVFSSLDETWCQTQYNGITGYTVARYLTKTKPNAPTATDAPAPVSTNTPVATSTPETGGSEPAETQKALDSTLRDPGRVIRVYVRPPAGHAALTLYDECSESGKALKNMPEGSEVEIVMAGETWCEVVYNDQQGYCKRDGLSFFED